MLSVNYMRKTHAFSTFPTGQFTARVWVQGNLGVVHSHMFLSLCDRAMVLNSMKLTSLVISMKLRKF